MKISDLSYHELIKNLESGKVYMQQSSIVNEDNSYRYFNDIKWYWNKDTIYMNNGEIETKLSANKSYKTPKDWLFYMGGRKGTIWKLTWNRLPIVKPSEKFRKIMNEIKTTNR